MREQVLKAREIQARRFTAERQKVNGRMASRQIRTYCKLEPDAESLLKQAMDSLGLSARAHDKVLRVARTIADLDAVESINAGHIGEAINYRTLDRRYWATG